MTEATESPAQQYQRLMVRLAGDGDPSERLEAQVDELAELILEAGDDIRERPAEGEWSVLELLGHMVDVEMVLGYRLRLSLCEPNPSHPAFDQDLWVEHQRYNEVADPAPLLAAVSALRPLNVALYRGSSSEQRARVALHAERGPESFDLTYRLLAGHGRFHMDQMRQTLAAIRARASAQSASNREDTL